MATPMQSRDAGAGNDGVRSPGKSVRFEKQKEEAGDALESLKEVEKPKEFQMRKILMKLSSFFLNSILISKGKLNFPLK